MRSIPVSMTWEVLARGRWGLAFATLGAIAFPSMILIALQHDGHVDAQDRSMLIMNVVMMYVDVMIFGAALYAARGRISRLYAYPARTSTLVAWRLLPAMVIIAVQMVACIATLNVLFDLRWPIWGPAMMAGVAVAAVQAAVWLTEKSAHWLLVAVTIVGAMLGLWFKSRYGGMFSDPTHFWQQVTPADALTMLTIAATAYWVAVRAVSRNRRGDPPLSLGFIDWLERTFNSAPAADRRLDTPFRAQCWFEWQRKGWVMPTGVFFMLVVGLVAWRLGSRRAEDLFLGFLGGGAVLGFIGFIGGLLFGNVGPNDANYTMGHFLAARPMSDADMARAILRTAFKSLILAWSIWALAFVVVCGCLAASGSGAVLKWPNNVSLLYLPATLFGPWMVTSTFVSLGLAGRTEYVLQIFFTVVAAVFALMLASKFLLTPSAQTLLGRSLASVLGIVIMIACVTVFAAARRRRLIQSPTTWAAALAWATATVAIALQLPAEAEPRLLGYLLVATIVALAVAPVAAAPLALSSNRHR
jgi:hypothetical protein